MAEREGFGPLSPGEAKSPNNADLVDGVNGNDHEAVKRVAGLVDDVAGLRNRIAG